MASDPKQKGRRRVPVTFDYCSVLKCSIQAALVVLTCLSSSFYILPHFYVRWQSIACPINVRKKMPDNPAFQIPYIQHPHYILYTFFVRCASGLGWHQYDKISIQPISSLYMIHHYPCVPQVFAMCPRCERYRGHVCRCPDPHMFIIHYTSYTHCQTTARVLPSSCHIQDSHTYSIHFHTVCKRPHLWHRAGIIPSNPFLCHYNSIKHCLYHASISRVSY